MKLLTRALSHKTNAAIEHQIVDALSISRMDCRHGTHPNIAHHPRFGVHSSIEHSGPSDTTAEELAQSRVGAGIECAVIVIANDARSEILIAETKAGRFLAGAIIVLRITNELTSRHGSDQFGMRIFNRWRNRQL